MAHAVRSPPCEPHAPRSPFRAPPSAEAHALTCPRPPSRHAATPPALVSSRPARRTSPGPGLLLRLCLHSSLPACPPLAPPGVRLGRQPPRHSQAWTCSAHGNEPAPSTPALGRTLWRCKRWHRGRSCLHLSPPLPRGHSVLRPRPAPPTRTVRAPPWPPALLSCRPLPASEPTRVPGPRRVCSTRARGRHAGTRLPSLALVTQTRPAPCPTYAELVGWFPRPQRRRRLLPTELGRPEPREAGGRTWKSELRRSTFT